MDDLNKILSHFSISGHSYSIRPFGSGHINDTFLAEPTSPGKSSYILQKVNHTIFRDITGLTNNILTVVRHVTNRLSATPLQNGRRFELPLLIPTLHGGYIFTDQKGAPWRMMNYIGGSLSFDRIASSDMAREAGYAYGLFHHLTSDLNPYSLTEVLPKFHNLSSRLENFRKTIHEDPAGRVQATRQEIDFAFSRADEMLRMEQAGLQGKFPLRVTHNDTKINNVLFDENQKAIAVVDLDTVMPGLLLFDFGDAIRTGTATCDEDEADLSKAGINLDLFSAYTKGFLKATSTIITPAETEYLAFSARVMTFIIGLRFLTDHLDGDRYYKTAYPGHNLHRAKVQFALLRSMEIEAGNMEKIVKEIRSDAKPDGVFETRRVSC